jgi:cation diffusion facilitator family transporter
MTTLEATLEKKRVALSSVIAALAITTLKLIVGLETNSLGILSEAAHSGLDLVAALITLMAVTIADRPPDKDHMYGHGKIENLSAFSETLLLLVTCGWIIYEAVERLVSRTALVDANVWGYGVIALSIIIDFSRSRALRRAAKKHKSQALEADALHFSSDIWSSLVVLIGLVFVNLGQPLIDSVAAIIVALLVLIVTYRLGKRTIDALMDRVPEGLYDELVELVGQVEGVSSVKLIRIRPSGPRTFVDTTVAIPRTLPFQQAHDVMDNIEKAIQARHQDFDVVVHAEPHEAKDETFAERIRMIIMGKGLGTPHNLEIHRRNKRYHIDFDIEYSKGKMLVEAHNLSAQIEREIRASLPDVEKVTIHMEEYHAGLNEISDDAGLDGQLRAEIGEYITAEKRILRYSGLTLLKIGTKYNLSVDCQFDRTRTLDDTHQIICELEARLYERFKMLRRITIHAEPA